MRTERMAAAGTLFLAALLTCGDAQAQHSGDVWIGRSAADQLTWDQECPPPPAGCGFNPELGLTVLPPDAFGGWSDDSPGFDRITADQPGENLYMLEPGAQIWLAIVAVTDPDPDPALEDLLIDPAFYIYEPVGQRFYPDEQGGQVLRAFQLGDYQLHKHVLWFVDDLDPAFDPTECVWEVTLRLEDRGTTGYADSEPFTLRFMIHDPIPADFDGDCDVDRDDYDLFEACATGPSVFYDPENPPAGCDLPPDANGILPPDLDADGDVDQADFGVFQGCMSGAGVIADPECAD